jgi:hypothetical protein
MRGFGEQRNLTPGTRMSRATLALVLLALGGEAAAAR